MFGLLKTTTLEFIGMRPEDGGVHSFAFHPTRPLHARAGQHGLLTLSGAGTKAFSLASAPRDPDVLIGTGLQSASRYKLALAALRRGQRATLHGPILNFTLDTAERQVVFLAHGVGIIPFRSLLRDITLTGLATQTTLIHVGRGHAYRSDTEPLAGSAHYPTDAESFRRELAAALSSQPDATYYLSGASEFIADTTAVLSRSDVSSKHIKKDQFVGYQAAAPRPAATPADAEPDVAPADRADRAAHI